LGQDWQEQEECMCLGVINVGKSFFHALPSDLDFQVILKPQEKLPREKEGCLAGGK